MANSRSALKRVRQNAKASARNRILKDRVKVSRRTALEDVEAGDSAAAKKAYDEFASATDKAAKRGAMHKNTASRLKGRVAQKINGLSA